MNALFAAPALALAAAACAPTGATMRQFDTARGGAFVSADLRAVIVSRAGPNGTITCAEPQPDAIRAVASEIAAQLKATVPLAGPSGATSLGNVDANAQLAAATREAVASLAMRTPTIQLMRDSLFRACEGVMNGVLNTGHVEFIASQIDNLAIGLHAIDGLTGMRAAPAVAIGTVGSAASPAAGGTQTAGGSVSLTIDARDPRNAMDAATARHVAGAVTCIVAITLNENNPGAEACARGFAAAAARR